MVDGGGLEPLDSEGPAAGIRPLRRRRRGDRPELLDGLAQVALADDGAAAVDVRLTATEKRRSLCLHPAADNSRSDEREHGYRHQEGYQRGFRHSVLIPHDPIYVRGQAFPALHKPEAAVAEFRKILDALSKRTSLLDGASFETQNSTSGGNRSSEHGARIAVAPDRHDLSVHDVDVLGERNDAECGVDLHQCDAVLAIDNEADDFDALHDAAEVIKSLPERCRASIRARRKLADGIRMKGESGSVVVAHGLDVLPHHLYHLFAHKPPRASRSSGTRIDSIGQQPARWRHQRADDIRVFDTSDDRFDVRPVTGRIGERHVAGDHRRIQRLS